VSALTYAEIIYILGIRSPVTEIRTAVAVGGRALGCRRRSEQLVNAGSQRIRSEGPLEEV
jgi:hypothetical protein